MTSKIKTKRERVKFASDNVACACPEVLDAIIKANEGDSTPYGNEVFVKLPRPIIERLNSEGYKMNEEELDGKAVRLVVAWNTKESDVDQLLEIIH